MNKNYHIDEMKPDEMKIALLWAKEEGWNPGLYDATCFYRVDPHGFFIGRLKDKIISVVSATNYDSEYAFCGFFIVHPKYRGKQYGVQLAQSVVSHVGDRNVGGDAVIQMVDKYKRMGFKFAHRNARYEFRPMKKRAPANANIKYLSDIPFELFQSYDRKHFPAARDSFLKCWISQPKSRALAYVDGEKLAGYGVIRACHQGYKIGPLFADTPEIAHALFAKLCKHAGNEPVYLDAPENNPHVAEFLKHYMPEKVFETARMYSKYEPDILTNEIYGITSYELG